MFFVVKLKCITIFRIDQVLYYTELIIFCDTRVTNWSIKTFILYRYLFQQGSFLCVCGDLICLF